MNDHDIEALLRKGPRVSAPPGLLDKLQAGIALPRAERPAASGGGWWFLFRRWIPAAACIVASVAVVAVQTGTASKLRQENDTLRAASQNLEQLRLDNAEYQRLLAQHQELERLRKDNLELQGLRTEVGQLREQAQEIVRLRAENQQLIATVQQPGGRSAANEDFFAQTEDARAKAQSIMCVNNLKQISLAARVWATDNMDVLPPYWLAMTNELSTPKILTCPADSTRVAAPSWASFSAANVSYEYLNPNGSETEPQVVLARCPIHNHVCLSDGSVHQLAKSRSIYMKDGKYYMSDSIQPAVDAETQMRRRYGLPDTQKFPVKPPANPAFSNYNRLMLERYGLVPVDTNKPPSP